MSNLTQTEQKVYELMQKNYSNQQISNELNMAYNTVRTHKKKINRKINGQIEQKAEENKSVTDFLQLQVQHLQSELRKFEKTSALENAILDQFSQKMQTFVPKSISIAPAPVKHAKDRSKQDFVALLSDIHGGEIIEMEDVLDLNEYNIDVMRERLMRWAKTVVSIVKNDMGNIPYDTAHIMLLGDLINGIIHQELLQGVAVCDQVVETMEAIAVAIEHIHEHCFNKIEIPCVIGNHGRFHKKPYFKKKWDNLDYLLYKMLELRLAHHKNIKLHIPRSALMTYDIHGWNFLIAHGDGIKGGFAGIPHYGISRWDNNVSRMLTVEKGIYPHYNVIGHFHQSIQLPKPGGEIIVNGSVKGVDEFALNAFSATNEPKQTVFWVHPQQGKTWATDIWLTDRKK